MDVHARQALFISHAAPEDNAFTLWLGAKLSALGYEVFADVLAERAIEGRSFDFGRVRTARLELAAN
jgi:hypothetical protein